jgi:hypothetical protein
MFEYYEEYDDNGKKRRRRRRRRAFAWWCCCGLGFLLRTDPENQIRNPDKVPSIFTSRPVTTTWPMPSAIGDTNVPRRRRFIISNVEFESLYNVRLLDQDFEITYTATDACGRTASCSQQVHLGTIANCTN